MANFIGKLCLFALLSLMLQTAAVAKEKSSPCKPKSKKCLATDVSGIAFIAFNQINQLGPMQDSINSAQAMLWPSSKPIVFHHLDLGFPNPDIDAVADQVEALVMDLKAQGYRRIGLPAASIFLAPYIRGTAGSLGGVNIQVRHPEVAFAVISPGTSAVDEASNVFRFLDVKSGFEQQEAAIANLIATGGEMLIIYEDDSLGNAILSVFADIADNLGVTHTDTPVTYNGSGYDAGPMNAAATAVNALPAGSLVVHIANGANVDAYAIAGNLAGIFVSTNSTRHFGGNFYPIATTIPVDLEYGVTPVDMPSLEMEKLGFPITVVDWRQEERATLYIEAYGWLANAGNFYGVHDHHLQFDADGTRISYEIADYFTPAGTTDYSEKNRRENPRWHADRFAWDWSTVFSD